MAAASGRDGEPGRAEPAAGSQPAPWRLAWRQWRRGRPFVGGLLVLLAGVEILLSEEAPLPLVVHIGLQGLAGYLVPVVMVLCGVLLLFHPVQQTFYSILAVLLALGSWITSNLGGFFVGMLLGLAGGALAFAWQPPGQYGAGRPRRVRAPDQPSAGLDLIRGRRSGDARRDGPRGGTGAGPGHPARSLTATAALAVPLAPIAPLAVSVLLAHVPGSPAGTVPWPSATSGTPSPAAGTRTPSPVTGSPVPYPTAPGSRSGSPAPAADRTPRPPGTAPPTPARGKRHRRPAAAGPAVPVPAARTRLTAGLAMFTGLSFDGVAEVRTPAGVVPMVKFRMTSLTLSGARLVTVTGDAGSSVTREASLGLTGDIVLYAARITGSAHGVRVTLSPRQPWQGLRPDLVLTDMVADQPFATADSLQASGLRIAGS